jgi:metal-responsive CopG/Arc/MetJ family transcriptional regulator
MSRRRASNPSKAISITLKQSTVDELDELLTYKQSRSKFIQDSLNLRLGTSKYVQDASTKQLMLALRLREDCDAVLHKLISQVLELDSLV